MSAIVWADVVNHAAELSGVAAGAQTDILAHVNTTLNVSVFGGEDSPKLKLARIYLAAHIATLQSLGGSSGEIQSETVGGVSYTYAPGSTTGGSFESTSYGQQYSALIRNSIARFPAVV
jgi:hypothetical protein